MLGSYQPVELANALERAGVQEYHITVADINDEVLSRFDGKKDIVCLYNFFAYFISQYGLASDSRRMPMLQKLSADYNLDFFPEGAMEGKPPYMLRVKVPARVFKKITTIKFDLISEHVPSADIIICTTVLTYYPDAAAEKQAEIIRAVNPNGYCLISGRVPGIASMEVLECLPGFEGADHNIGFSLLHKMS